MSSVLNPSSGSAIPNNNTNTLDTTVDTRDHAAPTVGEPPQQRPRASSLNSDATLTPSIRTELRPARDHLSEQEYAEFLEFQRQKHAHVPVRESPNTTLLSSSRKPERVPDRDAPFLVESDSDSDSDYTREYKARKAARKRAGKTKDPTIESDRTSLYGIPPSSAPASSSEVPSPGYLYEEELAGAPYAAPRYTELTDKKSWWTSFKERLSQWTTFKHEVSLAEGDRAALRDATEKMDSLPTRTKNAIASGFTELWSKVSTGELNENLSNMITIIMEVLPLAITNEDNTFSVLLAGITFRRGFLGAALVTGLALFVRQFLKRVWWAAHAEEVVVNPEIVYQSGFGTATDPDLDNEANETAASSIFSLVHYYTIGQLPDYTPKEMLNFLKDFNTVGIAARNIEHFGSYIVGWIKVCTNYLVHKVSGGYLFDSRQNVIRDEWLAVSEQANVKDLHPGVARRVISTMNEVIAKAAEASMPGELIARWKIRLESFNRHAQLKVPEFAVSHTNPPSVMIKLLGEPGIGKTLLEKLMVKALMKGSGYTQDMADSAMWYQAGLNFQIGVPTEPLVLVVDDAELIKDPETLLEVQAILAAMGSGKPVFFDAAATQDKALLLALFRFIIHVENRSSMVNTDTPNAMGRRYNGGQWVVTLSDDFKNQDGHIDMTRAMNALMVDDVKSADKIWQFYNTANREEFTFRELVSSLLITGDTLVANAERFEHALSKIGSTFTRMPTARPIAAPVNFQGAHANAHAVMAANKMRARGGVTYQAFTDHEVPNFINKQTDYPSANRTALITYLKAHPRIVTLCKGGFKVGDTVKSVSEMFSMVGAAQPAPQGDVRTPLQDWNHVTARAAQRCKFHVTLDNARFEEYDYISEGQRVTDAFLPSACETDFTGFCQWARLQSDNPIFHHFADDAAPTIQFRFPSLWTIAMALIGAPLIVTAINMVAYSMMPKIHITHQSAYSQKSALRAPKGKKIVTFGGEVKYQADMRPADWLPKTISDNTMSCRLYRDGQFQEFHILGLIGNLAATVKHPFQKEGYDTMVIVGRWAGSWPVKVLTTDQVELRSNCVQVILEPLGDLAWVVMPYNLPMFTNITKYLVEDDTSVDALTAMALAYRTHYTFQFLDENGAEVPYRTNKVAPAVMKPLVPFPLGDVKAMTEFEDQNALVINTVVATNGGDCGLGGYANNTQLGRGHKVLAYLHSGYIEATRKAVGVPLTHGSVAHIIERLKGKINKIDFQCLTVDTLDEFTHNKQDWNEVVAHPIAALPQQNAPYMNMRNHIVPSTIAGCLEGLTVEHPVTHEPVVLTETTHEPAQLWDVRGATKKLKLPNNPVDDDTHAIHLAAVKRVFQKIRAECNPKLLRPREELYSIKEALNGLPEFGVPALDMSKSTGCQPGQQFPRTHFVVRGADDQLDLLPEYYAIVELMTQKVLQHIMEAPLVVMNLKEELRQVVENTVKVPRVTQAFAFFYLIMTRRFCMTLPAILISGQLFNGSVVGTDLNSRDGAILHSIARQYGFHNDADFKNYDASQDSAYLGPIELETAATIRIIFPFLTFESSMIIAMGARICVLVLGALLYLSVVMMKSGHPLTTFLNTSGVLSTMVGAWDTCVEAEGDFFVENASFAYGDDGQTHTNVDGYNNFHFSDYVKRLNLHATPTQKNAVLQPHTDLETMTTLKRYLVKFSSGRVMAPLLPEVVGHIHAWVRSNDMGKRESTSVNAESSLREFFYWGEATFEAVKARLNAALIENGCRPSRLDYSNLRIEWMNKFGGVQVRRIGRPTEKSTEKITHQSKVGGVSTSSDGDDSSRVTVNSASSTQTDITSTVTTQRGLGKYSADSARIQNALSADVKDQLTNRLAVYPPAGVEGILGRQYLIRAFSWLATDAVGTTYPAFHLPSDLYVPKIVESLSSFKLFRNGVELTFTINGQPYVSGAIGFAYVPAAVTADPAIDSRFSPDSLPNLMGCFLSANTSASVTLELPWASRNTYIDLQNNPFENANGIVVPYVLAAQRWMSPTPPISLQINVFARFLSPQVAGYDLSPGPSVLLRTYSKKPVSFTKPTEKSSEKITHQSSVNSEAMTKSANGLLTGVASATSTVESVVGALKPLEPLIGLLDKPIAVSAAHPIRHTVLQDFANGAGLVDTTNMGMGVTNYVSLNSRNSGEANTTPSWDAVLGIPALVARYEITPATAVGVCFGVVPVEPTRTWTSGVNNDFFHFGPLAYYANMHHQWRGDIGYTIRVFGSSVTKCALRITHLPSSSELTEIVPNEQSGDVSTGVYELAGDRDIFIRARYDKQKAHSFVRNWNENANDNNSNGRLLFQVMQEFSTQIGVDGGGFQLLVYQHALPGFKLLNYVGLNSVFTLPILPARPQGRKPGQPFTKPTEKSKEKITHQASIRSIATGEYPSLTPGVSRYTSGMIAEDTTSGPIGLGKRFHPLALRGDNPEFTPAAVVRNDLVVGSQLWLLIAPYVGWSGSVNFKAIPSPGYTPNQLWMAYRCPTDTPRANIGPTVFSNTNVDPTLSFTDPYMQLGAYRTPYDPSDDYENYPIAVDTWDLTLTQNWFGYASFGDDFAVYHYACPPVFQLVEPAPRTPDPRGTRAPKPTAPVSTLEPTSSARYTLPNRERTDGNRGKE